MTAWPAIISKPKTDDGEWVLLPDGPYQVGQTIDVDVDSRAIREFKSGENTLLVDSVEMVSPQCPKIVWPVELLDGL